LKINTNISALQAQLSLQKTNRAIQRSLERLSTGQRINSARDDASGLAIATNLEADIRGYARISHSINESFGLLSVAAGALSVQTDMVQRMRELAIEAANGSLSEVSRGHLNTEFQQLFAEFQRLTTDTEFNSVKLLDGSFVNRSIQIGLHAGQTMALQIGSTVASSIFTKKVNDGSFQSRTTTSLNDGPKNVQSADFNEDGINDLVSSSYDGTLTTMIGKGDGTFDTPSTVSAGDQPLSLATGDINGDGHMDVVTVNSAELTGSPTVSIFYGEGNDSFEAAVTKSVGTDPASVQLGDLNNDGLLDIVVGNEGASNVSVLMNSGDKHFADQTQVTMGSGPEVALGDMNNDGILDLVTSDSGSSTVSVRLGKGDGTFKAKKVSGVGTGNYTVKVGDLNNDGKLDVVTGDVFDGTLSVLLGKGDGTFQTRSTLSASTNLEKISLADMNGDGILDILGANGIDATASIWFGKGSGTFKTAKTFDAGNNTQAVIAADLNGDGVNELVTADEGDGTISVSQGNYQVTSAVFDMSIGTQAGAQDVLSILNNALNNLADNRSQIGVQQNSFEYALSVMSKTKENLSSARSQIIDVDMGAEVSNLVRNQVLQNAGVAVLSQANVNLQLALRLLQNA